MSLDRGAYEAQSVGEELKYAALINSYTPGNFVSLPEEVTVQINGEDKTYPAGTYYGQIMQDQLDADGVTAKVWDAETQMSSGFDGWYNVENAKVYLDKAIEELAAEGLVIDAEHPIYLDVPTFTGSEVYNNREEALKQSVAAASDNRIVINKVDCPTSNDWYYAGYYYNPATKPTSISATCPAGAPTTAIRRAIWTPCCPTMPATWSRLWVSSDPGRDSARAKGAGDDGFRHPPFPPGPGATVSDVEDRPVCRSVTGGCY